MEKVISLISVTKWQREPSTYQKVQVLQADFMYVFASNHLKS